MTSGKLRGDMAENEGQFVTRTEFSAFAKEVTNELKGIAGMLDAKTRPNWSALGVGVAVLIALCGAMFYYFNMRIALAEASAKEHNHQMNVRVERIENKQDDEDRDYKIRYRDLMETMTDGNNRTPPKP